LSGGRSILGEQNFTFGQAPPFLILAGDGDQESMGCIIACGHLRRRCDGIVGIRWLAVANGLVQKARAGGMARMAGGGAGEQRSKHREGSGLPRVAAGERWLVAAGRRLIRHEQKQRDVSLRERLVDDDFGADGLRLLETQRPAPLCFACVIRLYARLPELWREYSMAEPEATKRIARLGQHQPGCLET